MASEAIRRPPMKVAMTTTFALTRVNLCSFSRSNTQEIIRMCGAISPEESTASRFSLSVGIALTKPLAFSRLACRST